MAVTTVMVNVICERGHRYKAPKNAVWPVCCAQCGRDAAPSWWFRENPASALEKAKAAIAAGRVEIGNEAAKAGPNAVKVRGFPRGIVFQWSRPGIGFGELTLRADNADGRLTVDKEGMSDRFCLDVLEQALKDAK